MHICWVLLQGGRNSSLFLGLEECTFWVLELTCWANMLFQSET